MIRSIQKIPACVAALFVVLVLLLLPETRLLSQATGTIRGTVTGAAEQPGFVDYYQPAKTNQLCIQEHQSLYNEDSKLLNYYVINKGHLGPAVYTGSINDLLMNTGSGLKPVNYTNTNTVKLVSHN